MQEPVHILIGFTPYHMVAMADIASRLNGVLYMFHPAHEILREEFDLPREVRFLGRGTGRLWRYASAARMLRRILNEHTSVSVYAPHPHHNPLSNYLLLSSGDAVKKNIYEDGILNYYDAKIPQLSWAEHIFMFARSLAVGLPYRVFSGHLSGVEEFDAEGGYFSHPDRVVLRDRFRELHQLDSKVLRSKRASPELGEVTLFLDQPIEKVLPAEEAALLRREAEKFARELGLPIVYKPHHDQGRWSSIQPSWAMVPRELRRLPAEVIVESSGVINVVGFFSSALANISNQHPSVHCFAVGADQISLTVSSEAASAGDLLSIFGVVVCKVGSASRQDLVMSSTPRG